MNYFLSMNSGRLGRKHFFLASILRFTILGLLIVITNNPAVSDEILWQKIIFWIMLAILWLFGYSISVRRFYDINANNVVSVILSILMGFPFSLLALLSIFLFFKKGTPSRNKYGEENSAKFIEAVFKFK